MSETKTIRIGDNVPELDGVTDDGSVLALGSMRGKWVVVYFYPKDATPGCTVEAQDFRDLHAQFSRRECAIIGVSRDSATTHEKFRGKQALPFALIADTDERWCRAFDVIHEKVLYGKRHLGVVRSTFLIDPGGVVRAEWRNVRVPGHAASVLEQLSSA